MLSAVIIAAALGGYGVGFWTSRAHWRRQLLTHIRRELGLPPLDNA